MLSLGCALSGFGLFNYYIVAFLAFTSLLGYFESINFMGVWESRELGCALETEEARELFIIHAAHKTKKSLTMIFVWLALMANPFVMMMMSKDEEQGKIGIVGLISLSTFFAAFGPLLGIWETVMLTHRESTLNRIQEYIKALSEVLFDEKIEAKEAIENLSLLWKEEGRLIEYNLHKVWSRIVSIGSLNTILTNVGYIFILFICPTTHTPVVPAQARYVLGVLVVIATFDSTRLYFQIAAGPYKASLRLLKSLKDPQNLLVASSKFSSSQTLLSWIETQDLKLYIGHIPVDDTLGGRVIAAMVSFLAFVAIVLVEKNENFLDVF